MARCVDHRDDTEALGLRIGNDLVHFGLRQFVRREIIISLVARMDRRSDLLTRIGRAVHGQAHIVQQEAHAVVADRKHHIVEASRSGIVNDLLDAVH